MRKDESTFYRRHGLWHLNKSYLGLYIWKPMAKKIGHWIINIYIYIYKIEAFVASTIFHISTIFKKKKKKRKPNKKKKNISAKKTYSKTDKCKYIFENPNPCFVVPLSSLFSTFSFPKTQHWKSILPRSHPDTVKSEIERRHHRTNYCPSRGKGYGYCV